MATTNNMPTPPASNDTSTIPSETIKQITTTLQDRYFLPISPTYLTTSLSTTRKPLPPIPALVSTLHFRLLASDITSSLSTSSPLPTNITDPTTKSQTLPRHTPVQLLDIIDVGTSRYSQLETLEMIARGEMVKGREIIRTVAVDDAAGEHGVTSTTARRDVGAAGPFRLLLQDARGAKVHAFTLSPIPKVGMPMPGDEGNGNAGMCIGCKLVLKKGTVARRGVIMLNPGDVNVLGGKVEAWDKQWRELEGRKKRLEQGMVGA